MKFFWYYSMIHQVLQVNLQENLSRGRKLYIDKEDKSCEVRAILWYNQNGIHNHKEHVFHFYMMYENLLCTRDKNLMHLRLLASWEPRFEFSLAMAFQSLWSWLLWWRWWFGGGIPWLKIGQDQRNYQCLRFDIETW